MSNIYENSSSGSSGWEVGRRDATWRKENNDYNHILFQVYVCEVKITKTSSLSDESVEKVELLFSWS